MMEMLLQVISLQREVVVGFFSAQRERVGTLTLFILLIFLIKLGKLLK